MGQNMSFETSYFCSEIQPKKLDIVDFRTLAILTPQFNHEVIRNGMNCFVKKTIRRLKCLYLLVYLSKIFG